MILRAWLVALAVGLANPAAAQQSDAAKARASTVFMSTFDALMNTTPSLGSPDYDAWEEAAKKAGITVERRDLLLNVPRFKPLFSSDNKVIAGAVVKYPFRLAQIPARTLAEWQKLTGLDPMSTGMSLTVEDEVFPQEKYSEKGFRSFLSKLK